MVVVVVVVVAHDQLFLLWLSLVQGFCVFGFREK